MTESATTVRGVDGLRGGFDVDMGDIDTFMTLAAIAPLADAPITIHGIGHARLKESDRITAVASNLRACGIRVAEGADWITGLPLRDAVKRASTQPYTCQRMKAVGTDIRATTVGPVPRPTHPPARHRKSF
ncbi:3-phosphoshikimate 1-carboxyvinyltransferase OS=Streptomyces glaucescens OX=1907 GN=aroA PE=3 SV=1 [Streptomyces glaucescens]